MIDCLIIGDSIAYGVSQFEPKCTEYTKVGISPTVFRNSYSHRYPAKYSKAIISLGSNNPSSEDNLRDNLYNIHDSVKADKIVWILPHNPVLKQRVKDIANHFGDSYVDFEAGSDKVHPKSYKKLDDDIKRKF